MTDEAWPPLALEEWRPSYQTLHLWIQTVGKIRTALTPLVNHWWNTTLYLTARGLTTGPIPSARGAFEIRFDFVDHTIAFEATQQERILFPLGPHPCADFYHRTMEALRTLGIEPQIDPMSCELPQNLRLDLDRDHHSYDRQQVHRWWRAMLSADTVLKEFRARFLGKSSPVHFFWGSFDLAVTRFSGRKAPPRPDADSITREAYSHEVISAGFWPGSGTVEGAAFYAYAAPQPAGFDAAPIRPAAARYDKTLGEYLLMYDDVRLSPSPRETLLDFLQSTYDAAADLAHWDRSNLERSR